MSDWTVADGSDTLPDEREGRGTERNPLVVRVERVGRMLELLAAVGCHHLVTYILSLLDSPALTTVGEACPAWRFLVHRYYWAAGAVRTRLTACREAGRGSWEGWQLRGGGAVVAGGTAAPDPGPGTHQVWLLLRLPGPAYQLVEWMARPGRGAVEAGRWAVPGLGGCNIPTCAEWRARLLVAGTANGPVLLCQPGQPNMLRTKATVATHRSAVTVVAVRDQLVITASQDCSLTVVRLCRDGAVAVARLLHGHVSRVRCVSTAGQFILSGSDDRSAKLWRVRGGSGALLTLAGHAWPVL